MRNTEKNRAEVSTNEAAPPNSNQISPPTKPTTVKAEIYSFVRTLVVILGLALVLRVCVVEPFKIPSASMVPTLQIGDFILVLKFKYGLRLPLVTNSAITWDQPKRGDVVVFTRPDDPNSSEEDDSKINIIKRVVALPGETVSVRGAQVYINGEPLSEPYARWSEGGNLEGNFGPETIPEGHILLLGDNRDHSKDSRFWTDPFLDMKRVKGRAVLIFWSWDDLFRIGTPIR